MPFRKKKNGDIDGEMADDLADDLGEGMTDADDDEEDVNLDDLPFNELPIEEQSKRLPKRPKSRRSWLSKLLIITLFLSPFGATAVAMIPILDPETGWRLFHTGGPESTMTVPGTERELQEEIARGVQDVQDRDRAAQEAANGENGDGQSAEDIAGDLDGVSDLIGTPGATDSTGDNAPTPEELAALIEEEGSLDDPIEPDPLRPAPLPGLDEEGSFGRVPRIGDDGTTPFDAYKRPFELPEDTPVVAVVLTGVGLNDQRTETAINDLPLNISLAISPYARDLQTVARDARAMGHEVFLELPMEPADFPLSDPGPRALLTSLSEGENLVRLEWLLARFPGYAGLVSRQGSKFGSLDSAIRPVIEFISRTGLMYIEGSGSGVASYGAQLAANAGSPNAIGNVIIDDTPSRRQIDRRLAELVEIAKREGVAVGIAQSYPVTIQRLRNWAFRLKRQGVVLVPVSAVSGQQVPEQSADEAEAARLEAEEREREAMAEQAAQEEENAEPANTIENE
ncbi:divergent polysaccharide deacetylase family protein [Thalassospira sp. HF15]|uniref:divergent polysaccharide deacetylase family protein n=1 Tax=Thalassospira sp. HF15 TaxID=2722755 RepID=UPI00142F6076|nr:divergent polysaccharide deacetylase family protein [Thalassospira sp. HF15]NIY76581.1 divergent polysaccharide deacetylase family protein [Thalassospira sp. HF15]